MRRHHTPSRPTSAATAVSPDAEAWMVFGMRLLLAVSAVLTLHIGADSVHLPGIYVHRIVLNASPEKRIEKRTITEKAGV